MPAPPTDLAVTQIDANTVEISWTDNSAVEDTYEVGYGLGGCHDSFDEGMIASLPANSTSYQTAAPDPACTHDYFTVASLRLGSYEGPIIVAAP
jgi:hypothetical protein